MDWPIAYAIAAVGEACYMLGYKAALGQKGRLNLFMCLLCGAAWPGMVIYGAYLKHQGRATP